MVSWVLVASFVALGFLASVFSYALGRRAGAELGEELARAQAEEAYLLAPPGLTPLSQVRYRQRRFNRYGEAVIVIDFSKKEGFRWESTEDCSPGVTHWRDSALVEAYPYVEISPSKASSSLPSPGQLSLVLDE